MRSMWQNPQYPITIYKGKGNCSAHALALEYSILAKIDSKISLVVRVIVHLSVSLDAPTLSAIAHKIAV